MVNQRGAKNVHIVWRAFINVLHLQRNLRRFQKERTGFIINYRFKPVYNIVDMSQSNLCGLAHFTYLEALFLDRLYELLLRFYPKS